MNQLQRRILLELDNLGDDVLEITEQELYQRLGDDGVSAVRFHDAVRDLAYGGDKLINLRYRTKKTDFKSIYGSGQPGDNPYVDLTWRGRDEIRRVTETINAAAMTLASPARRRWRWR